ncbi:phosphatidylglycerophosphatase A family protein [Thalassospira lucentensis]|uniref:phosphatidylglycerophosphatase A family protein n=1 Tax=Thalassospira lucentensis TaxID=168935 RepID=UPI00142D3E46|nr:phosphatidylglycerophosphatase A [Thalassospira lucentensis]NIZ02164.1 phosphatidylglycerophosphatase A [Thalassospira lucentensis]
MSFFRFLITCSATWFYSGKSPKAPGTAGSFAALPFGWLLWAYGGNPALLIASIIVFIVGIFIADRYSHMIGVHDPGEIVIDEVVAQWLCLMVIPLGNGWIDLAWLFTAFVAFRVFDVLKPWPVGWVDRRVGGGFGIMCDDVVAAVFAMIVLAGLNYFIAGGFA